MSTAPLDRAWLLAHLPHQGNMCLNEAVLAWDAQRLAARATSHRDPAHPLRHAGRLSILAGIEYAAQAAALHGALVAGGHMPPPGMLGSVRHVRCMASWLDEIASPLTVRIERQHGDDRALLYAFALEGDGRTLLAGRLSVVLGLLDLPSRTPLPT